MYIHRRESDCFFLKGSVCLSVRGRGSRLSFNITLIYKKKISVYTYHKYCCTCTYIFFLIEENYSNMNEGRRILLYNNNVFFFRG